MMMETPTSELSRRDWKTSSRMESGSRSGRRTAYTPSTSVMALGSCGAKKFDALFYAYAKFGQVHRRTGEMPLMNLVKWMKQSSIVPTLVSSGISDIVFKRIAGNRTSLSMNDTQRFLRHIARRVGWSVDQLVKMLESCGPPTRHVLPKDTVHPDVVERLARVKHDHTTCEHCIHRDRCRGRDGSVSPDSNRNHQHYSNDGDAMSDEFYADQSTMTMPAPPPPHPAAPPPNTPLVYNKRGVLVHARPTIVPRLLTNCQMSTGDERSLYSSCAGGAAPSSARSVGTSACDCGGNNNGGNAGNGNGKWTLVCHNCDRVHNVSFSPPSVASSAAAAVVAATGVGTAAPRRQQTITACGDKC